MNLDRLHSLRTDHNLTQSQIAEAIHVSQRAYSHYETGTRAVPVEILIALCDYYQVSVDYLIGRTDCPKMPAISRKRSSASSRLK